jgi:predicted site-specific integrase-resolvase
LSQVIGGAIRYYRDLVSRPPRMLTTAEAADVIGIHRKTLSKYVADGKVKPTLRLPSGHMRWEVEDLKAQLRALDDRPD